MVEAWAMIGLVICFTVLVNLDNTDDAIGLGAGFCKLFEAYARALLIVATVLVKFPMATDFLVF